MSEFDKSSSIDTQDWLYDMGLVNSIYITTDETSDFQMEKGKRYFMDFDTGAIPSDKLSSMSDRELISQFVLEMREMGHEPAPVSVSMPAINVVRITFTANPMHIILVVAIAVAAILIAVGVAGGLFVGFLGLGEALVDIIEVPLKITKEILKNPIPVIAIIVAVGIFIFGVKA